MFLTAWSNPENPAPGIFSSKVEVVQNGASHDLLWNHSKMYWSSGEWTGKNFVNVPEIDRDYYIKNFRFVKTENESYFTFDAGFPSVDTRFVLDYTGQLKQIVWGKDFTEWAIYWTRPTLQWWKIAASELIASYIVNSSHGAVTLLDNRLEGNADMEELSRACKIACWCIQDDEKERPTMGQVVRFLEGVSELGTPPIPRFLRRLLKMAPPFKRRLTVCNSNLYMSKSPSLNQISS
uniref:S-locus glycoprotein domain-containing protein n=1 Tax=Vitis vinifera TaxID=29760 RepID=F6H5E1_VITVI